jgi:hypothetical protein
MLDLMRWLVYWVVLFPIIKRDYRLREAGERPDLWHPADMLACRWGYYTPL